MTTATTTTAIDMTTNAGYNAWVAELITMFFTTLGLTQTADTGQTNGTGLVRPAANTYNAYIVGRFNDTAQATNPIFFRIDFGMGAANVPEIGIQLGTGSNGSGTLTGLTTLAQVGCSSATAPSSTVNPFVTRACYSAADGVFWLGWKMGAPGTSYQSMAGFLIFRSVDNTGAPTTDSTHLVTNGSTANSQGSNFSAVFMQVISHLNNFAYTTTTNGTTWPNNQWVYVPFAWGGTIFAGNAQLAPAFQFTPVFGVTPWFAMVLNTELGIGSTISATIVGSSAHTYINAGFIFGTSSSFAFQSLSGATWGMVVPWE